MGNQAVRARPELAPAAAMDYATFLSRLSDKDRRSFERQLPAGAGDASVQGNPAQGKPHHFTVEFPSSLLKPGDNQIDIVNAAGSWMLYDGIALEVPAGIHRVAVIYEDKWFRWGFIITLISLAMCLTAWWVVGGQTMLRKS